MRYLLPLTLVALFLSGCAGFGKWKADEKVEYPAPPPGSPETLVDAMTRFYEGMASTEAADREGALRGILPTEADFQALFGDAAPPIWEKFLEVSRKLFENLDEVAAEASKGGSVTKIDTHDQRVAAQEHPMPVLDMIPADVPVYRIVTHYAEGVAGSSSYLFVNDRWIWIRGFRSIPSLFEGEAKE